MAQALAVGVLFVAVSLIGYHAPHPHRASVDVVGSPQLVAALTNTIDQSEPGALELTRVPSITFGLSLLREGRTLGVLDLNSNPTLYVAGANGPAVTSALSAIFTHMIIASKTALHVIDKLPLLPNDTSGLPLFYLAFGVVIASYLFAIASVNLGRSLTPTGHWVSASLLALLLAVSCSLIARFGTRTIIAHTPIVFAFLFLLSLATSAGTAMFVTAFNTFGATISTVVLVILASASGGLLPTPWLPGWLGALRNILPMGAALSGMRDAVYFSGAGLIHCLFVLLLWTVTAVGYIAIARNFKKSTNPDHEKVSDAPT